MNINDLTGNLGFVGLTGAFFICIVLVLFSAYQHFRKNDTLERLLKVLVHVQTGLLCVAVLSLAVLLQRGAYEYEQVFNTIENGMPWGERLGGLWSGQASSLLFWSMIMSAAVSLSVVLANRLSKQGYLNSVVLILEVTLLFFIIPDVFISNPFQKLWMMPGGEIKAAIFLPDGAALLVAVDGQGMNPQLRHIAMLLHPPTLYLGLIGLFLPYAFALAGLINRDASHAWVKPLFPIALGSWVFLTIGMILGSWWAYTILGWGGYWGWDAVEISGLLPWLVSFGLVHSLRLSMRGKAFRKWVYGFSFAVVILIMLGILITRSGILESVHAYASGAMGPVLTILVLGHLGIVIFFSLSRKNLLAEGKQKGEPGLQEKLFRWFNTCIVGLVLIYLFGQTLPLTSQLVQGEAASFTAENYEQISAPLLAGLCLITALCPHAQLAEKSKKRFWVKILGLSCLGLLLPIVVLVKAEINLPTFVGFWVVGFTLLSWVDAIMVQVFLLVSQNRKALINKRMGMLLVHLGLAVMAVGILGVETLTRPYDIAIAPGESTSISGYTIGLADRNNRISENGNVIFEETVEFIEPDGIKQSIVTSINHLSKSGSLHAEPAIIVGFLQDIQFVLKEVPGSPDSVAEFRITFFPLMTWIWAGGGLMVGGGVVSMIDGLRGKKKIVRVGRFLHHKRGMM
jgi:cytochrome c-type biogenesis protein CcmF